MQPRVFRYVCSENIINMKICQISSTHSFMYIPTISKTCRGTRQPFTAEGPFTQHSELGIFKTRVMCAVNNESCNKLVLHQDHNKEQACIYQQHTIPSNGTSATKSLGAKLTPEEEI